MIDTVVANIRLAGFGGGVPSDEFDNTTTTTVMNFQNSYMKMKQPTGEVDSATASAIDEFGEKYGISAEDFKDLKCSCGTNTCKGFGKGLHKNKYWPGKPKTEAYYIYEYPGIHRSVLWALTALRFHLDQNPDIKARFHSFSSGYRCHEHPIVKSNKPQITWEKHLIFGLKKKWQRASGRGIMDLK